MLKHLSVFVGFALESLNLSLVETACLESGETITLSIVKRHFFIS